MDKIYCIMGAVIILNIFLSRWYAHQGKENTVMSNKRRLLMKVENKTDNKFLVKLVKAAVHDTPYMDSDIVIKDYDLDRVYLDINGEEFDIRTWNISEIGNSKIEIIYTLFKIKEDCGVSIKEDKVVIKCAG